jgi:hypothetical protein
MVSDGSCQAKIPLITSWRPWVGHFRFRFIRGFGVYRYSRVGIYLDPFSTGGYGRIEKTLN